MAKYVRLMALTLQALTICASVKLANRIQRNAERLLMEIRPSVDLGDFIGQTRAVSRLIEQIKGAKALGVPMANCLILGHAGLGKTALARSIAKEVGSNIHEISGSIHLAITDVANKAKAFEPMDIFFIDEIHATNRPFQVFVQRMITERVVPSSEAENGEKEIAPITVVGATDRPGLLLRALRSRFGNPVTLTPYTLLDMKNVVRLMACRKKMILTDDAATVLANASKGIPRVSEQHADALQKFAAARQLVDITAEIVRDFLSSQGLDDLGLSDLDRDYLGYLSRFSTVGVKLSSLASVLSIDATYLQREIEPVLQQLDLLHLDTRRFITLKGLKYLEGRKE